MYSTNLLRNGPLENLLGGGGGGEIQKKYMKKKFCTPINPKKYSCYGLKQINTRNLTTKKYFLRLENSPSPPP